MANKWEIIWFKGFMSHPDVEMSQLNVLTQVHKTGFGNHYGPKYAQYCWQLSWLCALNTCRLTEVRRPSDFFSR